MISTTGETTVKYDLTSSLQDKAVIVTGAGGGIGRAVVEGFASVGSRVLAVDLDQERVGEVVAGLAEPERHVGLGIDLTPLANHQKVLDTALGAFGRVDVLTHLAAVLRRRRSIDEITEEDWDLQMDVNLKAAFFLNRTIAQQMQAQGDGGRIINFSSQGWWSGGFGGSVVYAASKGGMVSMSRGLARSLAADGITVNTVAPGAVDTSMLRSGLTDEQLAEQVKPIPMGRMAKPEEMVSTVLYLASDQSSYVTGATINTSGGWLMY